MQFRRMTADCQIHSIVEGTDWDEMAQGLDWVQWLLRGVRQRCGGVLIQECVSVVDLEQRWVQLCEFVKSGSGMLLFQAARYAESREIDGMAALEAQWDSRLRPTQRAASLQAGRWLLSSTQGAKHTGMLHRVREAALAGELQGHFAVVWPVVAKVFQLSEVAIMAEYLRHEYLCGARSLPGEVINNYPAGTTEVIKSVLGQSSARWGEIWSGEQSREVLGELNLARESAF